jgi:hypothetical protein
MAYFNEQQTFTYQPWIDEVFDSRFSHGRHVFWEHRRLAQFARLGRTDTLLGWLGFYMDGAQPVPWGSHRAWYMLCVPYWFPMVLSLPAPLIAARRFLRRWRRHPEGRCPVCGYDLRASPERCPECGSIPA